MEADNKTTRGMAGNADGKTTAGLLDRLRALLGAVGDKLRVRFLTARREVK